jgi:hypothetical protein
LFFGSTFFIFIDFRAAECGKCINLRIKILPCRANSVDASFPANESVSIENGKPVIKRLTKREKPKGLDQILGLLEQRIPVCNITDVLSDTEHWLNWTQHFHPVSGYETKLLFPQQRYITTAFCYAHFVRWFTKKRKPQKPL